MFEPTLVQYENAQLIAKKETQAAIEANCLKAEKMILKNIEELISEGGSDDLDMLDVLMPPRIVEDSEKFWYQKVSRTPASSSDIERLEERFDDELVRQGASEIGLCDVRRNIYDQYFDELVRQEIIACPERGRLFRMIRRETEVSLTSLLRCYESGLAYGMKKRLLSCTESAQLTPQLTNLQSKLSDLNDAIRELEPKVAAAKKTTQAEETEKQAEFDAIESQINKENRSLQAAMREFINVKIDVEF